MASKTIQVSLPAELSSYVQRKIAGGRYHDAADVVRDALRQMEASEAEAELAQFERAVAGGHERPETEEDVRRVERAIQAARK